MKEIFPGIFIVQGKLATINSAKGFRVYDEKLIRKRGAEFRQWDPFRSKPAAAIKNGLKSFPIRQNSNVLYLGASGGTTPSHFADITQGIVYCVELSKRMMRELLPICERKPNMIPILGDANHPEQYCNKVSHIDIIYQDVAQPNQVEILIKNVRYFRPRQAMLAIKSRSIDSSKNPKKVFQRELEKLKEDFEVLQVIELKPFEKDHVFVNMSVKNR